MIGDTENPKKELEQPLHHDGNAGCKDADPSGHHAGHSHHHEHDYNRYSIKFDLDESDDIDGDVDDGQFPWKKALIIAVAALVLAVVIGLLLHRFGREIFRVMLEWLRRVVKREGVSSWIVLILVQFIFGWILLMPGLSTFNILQAFLMQSFWKPFLITFTGCYLASLSLFLIIKHFFRMKIVEKFKRKILFRIVYIEVKKRPWQMGFLFNLLFIPISLKNYLMPLTSITLYQYAIVLVPVHMGYCAMFAFVGYSMKDLNSLFDDVPFREKSTAAQVQTIVTYLLLILTVGLMVAFFFMAKKRYAEIEEQHRQEVERVKTHMKEMQLLQNNQKQDGEEDNHQAK